MFIPEPGDYFHVYNEKDGLEKTTIYQCRDVLADHIVCDFVVSSLKNWIPENHLCKFPRKQVSFWPVQPGYRQYIQGEKFDKGLKISDEKFRLAFQKYKQKA